EISVGGLALPRGEIQALRARKLGVGQRLFTTGQDAGFATVAVDLQHRGGAIRRACDAIEGTLVDRQLATAGILLGQLTQAMGVLFEEQAEAVAHPGQQQSAASQGLIADRAQLPGCRGAVEPRMRPGTFLLVWLEPPCTLAPWLPPIIAIAQSIKCPVLGKTRLLQRFLPIGTGQAANMSPMPVD